MNVPQEIICFNKGFGTNRTDIGEPRVIPLLGTTSAQVKIQFQLHLKIKSKSWVTML